MAVAELPRMRPTSALRRLPDWPERLAALVEAHRERPFVWGTHDCCTFAADAMQAVAGIDPAAPWRGAYDTEAGALACLDEGGLEATVARVLAEAGVPECPLRAAQRGDWVLAVVANEPLLGVVVGARIAVPGLDGLRFLPMSAAVRAWAI